MVEYAMSHYDMLRTLLASLALSLLVAVAGAQDFDQPVGSTTPAVNLAGVKIVQKLGSVIPQDTQFLDQHGKPVKLSDLLHSKPLIVVPIFYRCTGVCSLEYQSLLAALPKMKQKVGRDFDVVVVSIDPNEGPALAEGKWESTLASTPDLKGTESGWHFLTGDLKSIRSLTDALGFYYKYDASKDLINHPSGIMILMPDGLVSSYILGANYDPTILAANIDRAGKKLIGKRAPDVFFGCVHIDPLTGQRSIVIEGVLRLAGLVTVLGILGTVTMLGIGKRRQKTNP
jgi:protein SCO1